MKPIGPDHPITTQKHPRAVRVTFNGVVIAQSADVTALKEASYPIVFYFPRADIAMDHLLRTPHSTHCPYKGDASYYTLSAAGRDEVNAVWSYETPFDQMSAIAGRLAFYANRVSFEEDG